MEKILIVVPSRGRPKLVQDLINSWNQTTSGKSALILGLDEDDPTLDEYPAFMGIAFKGGMELNEKNNRLVNLAVELDCEIIGCLSDDFIFHTSGWEDIVISCQEKLKGICYGNDLLQGKALPTAPFIHRDIILPLGYAAPPVLKHYYIDNYWLELGMRLEKIMYLPQVVIEHRHWSVKKSQKDETYSNSEVLMAKDREAWDRYRETELSNDVKKIQSWQNKQLQQM